MRVATCFQASTTHLHANDKVTTDDLLHLLLIASDNAAAPPRPCLPGGSGSFIRRMNEKAYGLGLETTLRGSIRPPLRNVSSAYDMARLIAHASQDERISSIMRTSGVTVYSGGKRPITFGARTTCCAAAMWKCGRGRPASSQGGLLPRCDRARLPQSTHDVAVVVFGARTNAGRFMESRNLFNWASAKASTLFAAKPVTPESQH